MSEMAKSLRAKMRDKAKAMSSQKDSKVDSSDWSPAEMLNADVKTGLRPISRRAFKTGGKVMGEACAPRGDRKPRKKGGKVEVENEKSEAKQYAIAKMNRNVKEANEEREGIKQVGGMKKGGVAKKADGGKADDMPTTPPPAGMRTDALATSKPCFFSAAAISLLVTEPNSFPSTPAFCVICTIMPSSLAPAS